MGVVRDYVIGEDGVMITTVTENTRTPLGQGVLGATTGAAAEIVIASDQGTKRLRERVTQLPLHPGTRVSVRSPGGGGWGSPSERDPRAVAADVRNELVTTHEARTIYGVVVGAAGTLDLNATHELRRRLVRRCR